MKINKKIVLILLCLPPVFLFVAVLAVLIGTPVYLSSDNFKALVEDQAKTVLATGIEIGNIDFSWKSGMSVTGLKISNPPGFAPEHVLTVNEVMFDVHYSALFKKTAHVSFCIDALTANISRTADSKLNVDALVVSENAPQPSPPPEEESTEAAPVNLDMDISLPIDISADVLLKNITVNVTDGLTGKRFSLTNLNSEFACPSLLKKQVLFSLLTDLKIDDGEPSHQFLNLQVDHIFDKSNKLTLKEITVAIQGAFPGIDIDVNGNIFKDGINCNIHIVIPVLTDFLTPFMPESLASAIFSGTLDFDTRVSGDPTEKILLKTNIAGKEISMAGGPLGEGKLQDIKFSIVNNGQFDTKLMRFNLDEGRIDVFENSHIHYNLSAWELDSQSPFIEFHLSPLIIDLKEVYSHVKSAIPDDLRKSLDLSFKEFAMTLERLDVTGNPTGKMDVLLNDFILTLTDANINQNGQTASVRNFRFELPGMTTGLVNAFPASSEVSCGLTVDFLDIKDSANDIHLENLQIRDILIKAENLKSVPDSPLGISGNIILKEWMNMKNLHVAETVMLDMIHQSFKATAEIAHDGRVNFMLETLSADLTGIHPLIAEFNEIKTAANFSASIPEVAVTSIDPLSADVRGGLFTFDVDDMIHGSIQANARNLARDFFRTNGKITVNLDSVSEKILSIIDDTIHLKGDTDISWDVKGRLPDEKEIGTLESGVIDITKDFAFLKEATAGIHLQNVSVDQAQPDGTHISVSDISTEKPFKYTFTGTKGKGHLEGLMRVGKIEEIPGVVLKEPLSFTISTHASHNGLEQIKLTQTLEVAALNILEKLQVKLEGVNTLLETSASPDLKTVLDTLASDVSLAVTSTGTQKFDVVLQDPVVKGGINTDISFKLTPRKKVGGEVHVDIPQLSARSENMFDMNDFSMHLNFKKYYQISDSGKNKISSSPMLSEQVLTVETDFTSASSADQSNFERYIRETKSRFRPGYPVSMTSFEYTDAPIPVAIRNLEADVNTDRAIPSLEYFRVDLFGGTLTGKFAIDGNLPRFVVSSDISFTGIDTRNMFPEKRKVTEDPDTELSGKLSFSLPLTTEMKVLLRDMKFDIDFTHIGKRSLERMLYALDPTESDESIVSLRKVLKAGTPKWIRITVADGSLAVSGEVQVLDVTEKIPPISPVNLSNMTAILVYEDYLKDLIPVIEGLGMLTATHLSVDGSGNIEFQ